MKPNPTQPTDGTPNGEGHFTAPAADHPGKRSRRSVAGPDVYWARTLFFKFLYLGGFNLDNYLKEKRS